MYNVINRRKATNSTKRKPRGPPTNKKGMPEFLEALKVMIKAAPTTLIRKLARDSSISMPTMIKAVRDLRMKSRACPPCQLLMDKNRENRVIRGKKLLNWLKCNDTTVKIFSDKKMFTAD